MKNPSISLKHQSFFLIIALLLGFAIGVALDFSISDGDNTGSVHQSQAHNQRTGPRFTRAGDSKPGLMKMGEGVDATPGSVAATRRLVKQMEEWPLHNDVIISLEAGYLADSAIRTMDAKEVRLALGELEKGSYARNGQAKILMRMLLGRWSEIDQQAPLEYLSASSKIPAYVRDEFLYDVLISMAIRDPQSAREWRRKHPEALITYGGVDEAIERQAKRYNAH